ncbi:14295_t:CDS:1, partial [Funneliformis geosporum]
MMIIEMVKKEFKKTKKKLERFEKRKYELECKLDNKKYGIKK